MSYPNAEFPQSRNKCRIRYLAFLSLILYKQRLMKVELFDFDLPETSIATHPLEQRDAARMLLVNDSILNDAALRDLPSLLQPGDVMVFNNTKVIPARLAGKRGEANIEVTLHKKHSDDSWFVFAKPAKRLRIGETFVIAEDFTAIVQDKLETGEVLLQFNSKGAELLRKLEQYGSMPLPPYMRRKAEKEDNERYQTVFAKEAGAVAAPTAGLHFTPELLALLEAKGVKRVEVTLHVGAGTFLPVKVDDTKDHQMHVEEISITAEAAELINSARAKGNRIIAVGTTALRTLESVASPEGKLEAYNGETGIFITPGYRFRAVDILLTNFHLPRSTLFMLVSAFTGLDNMQKAYQHAIETGYRFYSYGDACLLFRNDHL